MLPGFLSIQRYYCLRKGRDRKTLAGMLLGESKYEARKGANFQKKRGLRGRTFKIRFSDFPGETFRVLKEKEEKKYGEYRTRRLVLEAWDKLELGI
jgi:hypothetical protein